MSDEYPWRLHGCPWSSVVVCPCIRSTSTRWVECPMMVGSYKEQKERLNELRAEQEECDEQDRTNIEPEHGSEIQ